MASLIHENDTHPLSRPSSRQMSTPRSSNQLKAPVPQQRGATPLSASQELFQLWGRNVTAGALTARSDDTDEDILVRALDITLGPLIGAKRGVRIEDVLHGGLGTAQAVAGYGHVSSSTKATKRKRPEMERDEDGEAMSSHKRRKQEPVLPSRIRSKHRRKRHAQHLSNGMDVDGERLGGSRSLSGCTRAYNEAAAANYEFTFTAPRSLSLVQMEEPNPDDIRESIMKILLEQGMSMDVLNETPSVPSAGEEPIGGHEHQSTELESRASPTPVPARSPTPPMEQPVIPTPSKEESPLEITSQTVAEAPVSTGGSPAQMQVDLPPEQDMVVEENQMQDDKPDAQATTETFLDPSVTTEAVDKTLQPIVDASDDAQSSNRLTTPVPMMTPVGFMSRSWHSPAPSSVADDHAPPPQEERKAPETRSRSPSVSDIDNRPPPESMSPPPVIIIRGRVVTPDSSREHTPAAASDVQDGSSELSGSKEDEEDEEEGESSGSENEQNEDEESDNETKPTSDDSGTLTPAPSPPSLPAAMQIVPEVARSSTPPHDIVPPAFESPLVPPIVATQAELVQKAEVQRLQEPLSTATLAAEARAPSVVPEQVLIQTTPQSSPAPEDVQPVGSSADHANSDRPQPVHVRRMTLKDYARRRKEAVVSPLAQTPGSLARTSSPGPLQASTIGEATSTEEPMPPLASTLPRRADATPLRVDLSPYPDLVSFKREQSTEVLPFPYSTHDANASFSLLL